MLPAAINNRPLFHTAHPKFPCEPPASNNAPDITGQKGRGCFCVETVQRFARKFFELLRKAARAVWDFAVSFFCSAPSKEKAADAAKRSLLTAKIEQKETFADSEKSKEMYKNVEILLADDEKQAKKPFLLDEPKEDKRTFSLIPYSNPQIAHPNEEPSTALIPAAKTLRFQEQNMFGQAKLGREFSQLPSASQLDPGTHSSQKNEPCLDLQLVRTKAEKPVPSSNLLAALEHEDFDLSSLTNFITTPGQWDMPSLYSRLVNNEKEDFSLCHYLLGREDEHSYSLPRLLPPSQNALNDGLAFPSTRLPLQLTYENKEEGLPAKSTPRQKEPNPFFSRLPEALVFRELIPYLDLRDRVNILCSKWFLRFQTLMTVPPSSQELEKQNLCIPRLEVLFIPLETTDNDVLIELAAKIQEGSVPNLKRLHVESFESRTSWNRFSYLECGITALLPKLPALERVTSFPPENPMSYDKFASKPLLKALGNHCPRLREFDFSWQLQKLTPPQFDTISKKFPNLEIARLTDYQGHYHPSLLEAVLNNCPRLKEIDLSRNKVDAKSLLLLGKRCPQLETLLLDQLVQSLDIELSSLSTDWLSLKKFSISVAHSANPMIRKRMYAFNILSFLAHRCPNLEYLSMKADMSEAAVVKLSSLKLRILKLSGSEGMTSKDLNNILENQPLLQELNVDGVNGLDAPIHVSKPIGLKRLSLWGVTGISDEKLLPFLRCLPELEELTLSCGHLTDEFLYTLIQHCPKLKNLVISDPYSFSSEAFVKLRKKLPHLHIVQGLN